MPLRVLIALDKFKEALAAPAACAAVATALAQLRPDWEIEVCPLADGGDGFCEMLTRAVGGVFRTVRAPDARLAPREVACGRVAWGAIAPAARARLGDVVPGLRATDTIAVLEMAAVNGLTTVPPEARDPWQLTTVGTGACLRAAADAGAACLVLGLGGSATHDLGLGAIAELGWQALDADGAVITPPVPARWASIARLERSRAHELPPIVLACDVVSPLLGPTGAAWRFAAQKGLAADDLPRIEAASHRIAQMLCHAAGRDFATETVHPGAGAAGGLGFGLAVALGATFVPGSQLVADWLDLDSRVDRADIVITGEGRWDAGSLGGKAPGALVRRARAAGRHVFVLAGSVDPSLVADPDIVAITPPDTPLAEALPRTSLCLAAATRRLVETRSDVFGR